MRQLVIERKAWQEVGGQTHLRALVATDGIMQEDAAQLYEKSFGMLANLSHDDQEVIRKPWSSPFRDGFVSRTQVLYDILSEASKRDSCGWSLKQAAGPSPALTYIGDLSSAVDYAIARGVLAARGGDQGEALGSLRVGFAISNHVLAHPFSRNFLAHLRADQRLLKAYRMMCQSGMIRPTLELENVIETRSYRKMIRASFLADGAYAIDAHSRSAFLRGALPRYLPRFLVVGPASEELANYLRVLRTRAEFYEQPMSQQSVASLPVIKGRNAVFAIGRADVLESVNLEADRAEKLRLLALTMNDPVPAN